MSKRKGSTRPRADQAVACATPTTTAEELRTEARGWFARGVSPIRLRSRDRAAVGTLPNSTIREHTLSRLVDGDNLGILTGQDNGHVVHIDVEWAEGSEVCRFVFEDLGLPAFGRGERVTGLLCRSEGAAHKSFGLPNSLDLKELPSQHSLTPLELRPDNNGLVRVPPSVRAGKDGEPDERIVWLRAPGDELPLVEAKELRRRCGLAAFLTFVVRLISEGARDWSHWHLAGALVRHGYDGAFADRCNELIAQLTDDEEAQNRKKGTRTEKTAAKGGKTTGIPKLLESLGFDKPTAKLLGQTLASWLSGDDGQAMQRWFEEFNRRYLVSMVSGRTVVAKFEWDYGLQRETLVFSKKEALVDYWADTSVWSDEAEKPVQVFPLWWHWPKRRKFERIVLDPSDRAEPDCFNLWRGLSCEAKPGDWSTIRYHLLEVLCGGNEGYFDWLVRWAARCVQQPEARAESAVVLIGKQGTGKGAFAALLGRRYFRQHWQHVSHQEHFVGRFNSTLLDCLFVHVDECVSPNNKQAVAQFKSLVTEAQIQLEPKGLEKFQAPNRLKLVLTSNDSKVIEVTADDRRYFALRVSEKHAKDPVYFGKLWAAIEGEEAEHFLHDLLQLDLSDFDFRNPPHTDELNRHKLLSREPVVRWWHAVLNSGELLLGLRADERMFVKSDDGEADFQQMQDMRASWPAYVHKRDLYAAHAAWARAYNKGQAELSSNLSKLLFELVPDGRLRSVRPSAPAGEERPRQYAVPPLEDCREAFLRALNIEPETWDWGEDLEEAAEPEPKPKPPENVVPLVKRRQRAHSY